jgi:hypothetical protein
MPAYHTPIHFLNLYQIMIDVTTSFLHFGTLASQRKYFLQCSATLLPVLYVIVPQASKIIDHCIHFRTEMVNDSIAILICVTEWEWGGVRISFY